MKDTIINKLREIEHKESSAPLCIPLLIKQALVLKQKLTPIEHRRQYVA